MKIKNTKSILDNFFVISIISITLIINPITSYEPFSGPKFSALVILSVLLIFLIFISSPIKNLLVIGVPLSLVLIFLVATATLSLFLAPISIYQQLFGIDGRNTGFITFISFLMIFLVAMRLADESYLKKIVITLFSIGVICIFYGLIQSFDLDPINWSNQYNSSISFFGNPNFHSSLLGIFSSVIWAYFFANQTRRFKIVAILLLVITLFSILKTDSQQGLLLYGANFVISLFFWSLYSKSRRYPLTICLITILTIAFFVMDILRKLPWESIFYQNSISERGDLWRAAFSISKEYPLTGIGFDGFEYYYRRYRDVIAANRQGVGTSSNSAHNIYLDFLVNGGYLHLISYLLLVILVILSIFGIAKNLTNFEPNIVAIIGAWIAYQLQSLISVNNIGLSIWGWTLGGIIIGYHLKMKHVNILFPLAQLKPIKIAIPIILASIMIAFASFLGGAPLRADINFRAALESREIERVLDSAYQWPQSPQRMFQVSSVLEKNSLFDLANQVSADAVELFPGSFENLEQYYSLPNLTEQEKLKIFAQMRKIDPLNPKYR